MSTLTSPRTNRPPQVQREPARWRAVARSVVNTMAVPVLAVFTALLLGGLLIWVTTGDLFKVIGPEGAFAGLWNGAFGSPRRIATTLITATPYIFAGLAVALAFKCGLFNIGAEGQLAMGAVTAAWAGYAIHGLPFPLHMLLAFAAGLLGGLLWGAIPGILKAYTGAHEVIITIMLNYVALLFVQFLLSGPMKDRAPGNVTARTPLIQPEAQLPSIFDGTPWEMHIGVVIAILTAVLVQIFLTRTTWGFEIRTVGANQHAARYAGISVARNIILAMSLSGMLAGAAGTVEVLGVTHRHELGFGSGYGFDSIAIALLGRSNPYGVVAAAILFGALKAGATQMQFNTQISASIISVVQGLVLLFVAADVIIRWLFMLKVPSQRGALTLEPAAALAAVASVKGEVSSTPTATFTETYPTTLSADIEPSPVFTGSKEGDEETTKRTDSGGNVE